MSAAPLRREARFADLAGGAGGGQRHGEQDELVDDVEKHEEPDGAGDDRVGGLASVRCT